MSGGEARGSPILPCTIAVTDGSMARAAKALWRDREAMNLIQWLWNGADAGVVQEAMFLRFMVRCVGHLRAAQGMTG